MNFRAFLRKLEDSLLEGTYEKQDPYLRIGQWHTGQMLVSKTSTTRIMSTILDCHAVRDTRLYLVRIDAGNYAHLGWAGCS